MRKRKCRRRGKNEVENKKEKKNKLAKAEPMC